MQVAIMGHLSSSHSFLHVSVSQAPLQLLDSEEILSVVYGKDWGAMTGRTKEMEGAE
jgi:hypothetical protein